MGGPGACSSSRSASATPRTRRHCTHRPAYRCRRHVIGGVAARAVLRPRQSPRPRRSQVTVHVNDGRHHLRMQRSSTYDLITLELPPISHAGVASLYSREFWPQLARSRLQPGGYVTQWRPTCTRCPLTWRCRWSTRSSTSFPTRVLLSGSGQGARSAGRQGGAARRSTPTPSADAWPPPLRSRPISTVVSLGTSWSSSGHSSRRPTRSIPLYAHTGPSPTTTHSWNTGYCRHTHSSRIYGMPIQLVHASAGPHVVSEVLRRWTADRRPRESSRLHHRHVAGSQGRGRR